VLFPIRPCTFAVFLLQIIRFLSLIGFVGGFLVLVFFISVTTSQHRFLDAVEFPLPNVSNVVIDAEDRVLVNIVSYGRVQIYDQNGQFLRGFFSVAPMEPSFIGFDEDGRIAVVTHRGDGISVFADDGSLLRQDSGGRTIESKWKKHPQWTRDSNGQEYRVRNKWLSPQVVKVLANEEEVFITTPFYLWPFVAPIPCLISIVVTQVIIKRLSRKIPTEESAVANLIASAESENDENRTCGG
jgi:hypothetical protein